MCVTHGLASVNPRKHLIGHHLDWARGFPFGAFGLPDQYPARLAGVVLFGFGYDEQFLAVMGEPWPGVGEAERELANDAAAAGRTVEGLRRERAGTTTLARRADERHGDGGKSGVARREKRIVMAENKDHLWKSPEESPTRSRTW